MKKFRWPFISIFGAIFFGVVLQKLSVPPLLAYSTCVILGLGSYVFFKRMKREEGA